jgi:hypothetical protein
LGTQLTFVVEAIDPGLDELSFTNDTGEGVITNWVNNLGNARQGIEFFVNGIRSAPDAVTWDSVNEIARANFAWTPAEVGRFEIVAVAHDDDGHHRSSKAFTIDVVTGQSPTISVVNIDHLSGLLLPVGSAVPVIVDSNLTIQSIAKIELYANGVLRSESNSSLTGNRYQVSFLPSVPGLYNLQLFSVDAAENRSPAAKSFPVTFKTVLNERIPSVEMLSPVNGLSLSTVSSTVLAAGAADIDGNLLSLQFYVDGQKYGDEIIRPSSPYADAYPYAKVWNLSDHGPGLHTVYAVAKDTNGNISISDPVTVTVFPGSNPPPQPKFLGTFQLAEATATVDAGGAVSSISISNTGFGYTRNPIIRFENFGSGGSGAEAVASSISSYGITEITITKGGSGYLTPPKIFIEGGFPVMQPSGVPATAAVIYLDSETTPDQNGNPRGIYGIDINGVHV